MQAKGEELEGSYSCHRSSGSTASLLDGSRIVIEIVESRRAIGIQRLTGHDLAADQVDVSGLPSFMESHQAMKEGANCQNCGALDVPDVAVQQTASANDPARKPSLLGEHPSAPEPRESVAWEEAYSAPEPTRT